jgi:hypothetical protein
MTELITFLADNPSIAIAMVAALLIILMYYLRQQSHLAISRIAQFVHRQLRLVAKFCGMAAHRIRLRNHEVMNALARELAERRLDREFMRIESLVEKDLSHYQTLAAAIYQQIHDINEDYEASANMPLEAPEWVAAVEAMARLESEERNTEVMTRILSDVHNTVKQYHKDVMREHRWTVSARHKLLGSLRPRWRKLGKLLERIGGNVEVLEYRLKRVDRQMDTFKHLRSSTEQGVMSSVFIRFTISVLFVAFGVAAMALNYELLFAPLDAVMQQRQLMGISLAAYISGLYIAMLLAAATLCFEGLRITHLLPLMAAMTQRGRYLMIAGGAALLLMLSLLEAAVVGSFAGSQATLAAMEGSSQAIMFALALVTPLMLSLVIIPIEYFLHTVRPVIGVLLQSLFHGLALLLRMLGSTSVELGKLTIQLYDAIIFIPLVLARNWQQRKEAMNAQVKSTPATSTSVDVQVSSDKNVTTYDFASAADRKNKH